MTIADKVKKALISISLIGNLLINDLSFAQFSAQEQTNENKNPKQEKVIDIKTETPIDIYRIKYLSFKP